MPKENNEFVRQVAEQKYEFGFTTDVHTEIIEKGLNEDIVRLISAKKGEPEWMLEFRLKAFRYWKEQTEPKWGHVHVPPIDYQEISYYADPLAKKPKNKEIDPELEKTFDKLGIPLEEHVCKLWFSPRIRRLLHLRHATDCDLLFHCVSYSKSL